MPSKLWDDFTFPFPNFNSVSNNLVVQQELRQILGTV